MSEPGFSEQQGAVRIWRSGWGVGWKRYARIDGAVAGFLSEDEQLIVCIPRSWCVADESRRVDNGAVPVAVTDQRVLFFQHSGGWLNLADAPSREEVELVEHSSQNIEGSRVTEFRLKVRNQRLHLVIPEHWTDRAETAARELATRAPEDRRAG
jgi:hypothetical protein